MEWINLFDCIVFKTASLTLIFAVQFFSSSDLISVSRERQRLSPGALCKAEGVPPSTGSG